jgi:hypothetical protein
MAYDGGCFERGVAGENQGIELVVPEIESTAPAEKSGRFFSNNE